MANGPWQSFMPPSRCAKGVQGEIELGVTVVIIAELVHGAYRTKTQEQQQRRLELIDRLSSDVPVHPVTLDIARLARRIEGQQEAIGAPQDGD
jgi:predicted nucleic acid-binding protein